jgi:hypothetical protein
MNNKRVTTPSPGYVPVEITPYQFPQKTDKIKDIIKKRPVTCLGNANNFSGVKKGSTCNIFE